MPLHSLQAWQARPLLAPSSPRRSVFRRSSLNVQCSAADGQEGASTSLPACPQATVCPPRGCGGSASDRQQQAEAAAAAVCPPVKKSRQNTQGTTMQTSRALLRAATLPWSARGSGRAGRCWRALPSVMLKATSLAPSCLHVIQQTAAPDAACTHLHRRPRCRPAGRGTRTHAPQ